MGQRVLLHYANNGYSLQFGLGVSLRLGSVTSVRAKPAPGHEHLQTVRDAAAAGLWGAGGSLAGEPAAHRAGVQHPPGRGLMANAASVVRESANNGFVFG